MLEKIKNFFGFGKAGNTQAEDQAAHEEAVKALVRLIARGYETQELLFAPENAECLTGFVEYGHRFSREYLNRFLQTADSRLVRIYIELGEEMDDEAKQIVIDRKDPALMHAMIESGVWAPFPHGSCLSHPIGDHHQSVVNDEFDELYPAHA